MTAVRHAVLAALATAAALLAADAARALTIPVPERVLQARIREQFPRVQRTPLGVDVTLADPEVSLADPGGRVRLAMDATIGLPGREAVGGRVDVSGLVRFDAAQGRFLLDDPRVESLDVPGLPPAWAGPVRAAVNAAAASLLRSLRSTRWAAAAWPSPTPGGTSRRCACRTAGCCSSSSDPAPLRGSAPLHETRQRLPAVAPHGRDLAHAVDRLAPAQRIGQHPLRFSICPCGTNSCGWSNGARRSARARRSASAGRPPARRSPRG
jgi:hypothetical protein